MSDKIIENNQVTIMGEIASDFTFSHEVFGEGFYMVEVKVKRLSNSEDRIPPFAGGEQTIWKIRLHTMYLLGKKCEICFCI